MQTYKIEVLVLLTVAFLSSLFAENKNFTSTTLGVQAAFVQKVAGAGRVIEAIQTRDGNFVTLSTLVPGSGSFLVRKTTPSGERIWERSLFIDVLYGGFVFIETIAETNDGYVIVGSGTLSGYYGPGAAILITLHSNGTLNRSLKFEVTSGQFIFNWVNSMPDGGFLVTGGRYPPIFHPIVIRFNADGSILWAKHFEDLTVGFSSHAVLRNGVVLASEVYSGNGDTIGVNLVKIGSAGGINWSKNLKINNAVLSVGAALNNGIIIASHPERSNILSLVRLDQTGKIQWKAKYYLGVAAFGISRVTQDADGSYVITGSTGDKAGNTKSGFFIKINSLGKLILQKILGFDRFSDEAQALFATQNGGYVLFGSTYDSSGAKNDTLFLNLNSNGVVPGCNFVRHLNVRRLQPPVVSISTPTITSQPLPWPSYAPLEIRTAASRKPASITCR